VSDDGSRESGSSPAEPLPSARVATHRHISPIWIVPIVAAVLVAYLAYTTLRARGPTITVTFETANGLREEQTQVKHKSVPLGTVEAIELGDDARHVIVHLRMNARARDMLTEDARFWVVRPRLSAGVLAAMQTSLETLVSGAYIELEPGTKGKQRREEFEGLEQPPAVRSGEPGTVFTLRTEELGSLGSGSPIMHRHVNVGEVLDQRLDGETGAVTVRAFVRAPHDALVREATLFWNASGLAVGMGADGLHVEVESMRTMFSGGIVFRTPDSAKQSPRARSGQSFKLYDNEASAELYLFGPTVSYVTYFHDSVEGLSVGSAVQMFGIQVGNVTDRELVADPYGEEKHPIVRVVFALQPERALEGPSTRALERDAMRAHVLDGLRVVLETRSMITGEKALALSYLPDHAPSEVREEDGMLVLPSQSRGFGALTDALSDVATRLNRIPYEEIGRNLSRSLASVDRTLSGPELRDALVKLAATLDEVRGLAHEARAGLGPAFERLPHIADELEQAAGHANDLLGSVGDVDSDFRRGAVRLMDQVTDVARSIRLLADFLSAHPETLIRGRKEETSE
jgi:paraquat-inducible protein B